MGALQYIPRRKQADRLRGEVDTIKHLTVARLWMDSSDLSEINVGFLAGLRRKYFIPYKEENLKVGEKDI